MTTARLILLVFAAAFLFGAAVAGVLIFGKRCKAGDPGFELGGVLLRGCQQR